MSSCGRWLTMVQKCRYQEPPSSRKRCRAHDSAGVSKCFFSRHPPQQFSAHMCVIQFFPFSISIYAFTLFWSLAACSKRASGTFGRPYFHPNGHSLTHNLVSGGPTKSNQIETEKKTLDVVALHRFSIKNFFNHSIEFCWFGWPHVRGFDS